MSMGTFVVALAVVFLIAGVPQASPDMLPDPEFHARPLGLAANWSVETVDVTSIADVALGLDAAGRPHVGYYPPGSVRYATREPMGWATTELARTAFGGASTCLAVTPQGVPHAFYTLDGFQHRWLEGGVWRQDTVEVRPGTLDRQCEAAVDGIGRLHVVWSSSLIANAPGDIMYATMDETGWSVEYLDAGGQVSGWASVAVDAFDRPHVLYYGDALRQIRYAVRNVDGSWAREVVDDAVGDIFRVGREGRLVLHDRTPVAVYASGFGSTELRLAERIEGGWVRSTLPEKATFLIHPSLAIRPDHVVCVAYEWALAIDETKIIWDQDLVLSCREAAGWVREVVHDGILDVPANLFEVAHNPSLAADACNSPHLVFWLGSRADPGIKYGTKGEPCEPRSVSVDVDPDTLNPRSRGKWVTAYAEAANSSIGEVDAQSLRLNGIAAAWTRVLDGTLVAKFDRAAVAATLTVGENEVVLTGMWKDGGTFTATDTIRVISSGRR